MQVTFRESSSKLTQMCVNIQSPVIQIGHLSGWLCLAQQERASHTSYSAKLLLKDRLCVAAPTGVAAFNVDGYTLHSLLSLPVKGDFKPLEGKRLQTIQQTLAAVDYCNLLHILYHLLLCQLKAMTLKFWIVHRPTFVRTSTIL